MTRPHRQKLKPTECPRDRKYPNLKLSVCESDCNSTKGL